MLAAEVLRELRAILGPERCRSAREVPLTYGCDASTVEALPRQRTGQRLSAGT
jgi:hypothetical protein